MATKNHAQPEVEAPQETRREYTETKAPSPPKGYRLVEAKSTAFGYIYYKYVQIEKTEESAAAKGSRGNPRRCVTF